MRVRHQLTFVALTAVVALIGLIVWNNHSPGANQIEQDNPNPPKPTAAPVLPVTQVILFNSGVGYYQREGDVQGDTQVQLTFPVSDINDLLKSLVLQDQDKGKVGVITYDSHDPVDKTLRSFAVNLNGNPTYGQILNQARGERVEVVYRPRRDAPTEKLTGTIVGMQAQSQQIDKDRTVEVELLNLLSSAGLQSLPLEQIQTVRFLNMNLQTEFERALQVLASVHDTQKKTIHLQFLGNGKRHIKVGYVVERPIWKTSYRLLLKEKGKLFMQGWALVENTSDDDWKNVRVILVSGRPISYQMNLYEPLYIPRPWVEPELFASLRPPVYSGSMKGKKEDLNTGSHQTYQHIHGMKGKKKVEEEEEEVEGERKKWSERISPEIPKDLAGGREGQGKLTFDQLQQRRKGLEKKKDDAKKLGASLTGMNFKEGITSVATAEELGDYYQYVIEQKVNLPRQKSALLPILNQHLDGSKVSIFNEAVHAKYPLLGLRLKNTSGQPLTQGPITVYEDGAYAGDTRILDLQPNEERLLSYALDQSTEVKVTSTKRFLGGFQSSACNQ